MSGNETGSLPSCRPGDFTAGFRFANLVIRNPESVVPIEIPGFRLTDFPGQIEELEESRGRNDGLRGFAISFS